MSEEVIVNDISTVSRIKVVPMILEAICRTTGMGFAAIARVTPQRWVACSVRDEIRFGLVAGGELKVDTTICHEIRQSGSPVIIDHVAADEFYVHHHTPAMYGFQSYISVPIARKNGDFFGTLCAIDPHPALLNTPEIIGMFRTFANLISLHLDAADDRTAAETDLLEDNLSAELGSLVTAVASMQQDTTISRSNPKFVLTINDATEKINGILDKYK